MMTQGYGGSRIWAQEVVVVQENGGVDLFQTN
jgi:hypothetical protein